MIKDIEKDQSGKKTEMQPLRMLAKESRGNVKKSKQTANGEEQFTVKDTYMKCNNRP